MSFQIKCMNSMGDRESQLVSSGAALALINRLSKLGAKEIEVISASGYRWSLDQARIYFASAHSRH